MKLSKSVSIWAAGLLLIAQSGGAGAQTPAPDPGWIELPVAVMQGLDKITARISTFEAQVGETASFGTFSITPRACRKRPPTETPENAAFLEIDEQKPDEEQIRLFTGWMFSSSPALNAVEHPVYDVWLLDCKSSSTNGQSSGAE